MEAIGQLTGGVAHDFNNLLTAVLGGLELLRLDEEQHDRVPASGLGVIQHAAERGATLTVAFAGVLSQTRPWCRR